jgi:hypothetical protein
MFDRLMKTGAAPGVRARLVAAVAVLAAVIGLALACGSAARAVSASRVGEANGSVELISCTSTGNWSTGNCTAAGSLDPANPKALFAVSEENGAWGTAQAIPGLAALLGSTIWQVEIEVVSCSSAGVHNNIPYLVTEKKGNWGFSRQVMGTGPQIEDATGRAIHGTWSWRSRRRPWR